MTDRYTKAIEQLGSSNLEVRIGGVYALERVARDSARDHLTVMEVLAAFIRDHSHDRWRKHRSGTDMPKQATLPDVQAACTVIGRRDTTVPQDINLAAVNLAAADLTSANLARADLTGADLGGAILNGADLGGANLTGANFVRATFHIVRIYPERTETAPDGTVNRIRTMRFIRPKLAYAHLAGAKLTGVDLSRVDLGTPGWGCRTLAAPNSAAQGFLNIRKLQRDGRLIVARVSYSEPATMLPTLPDLKADRFLHAG